MTVVPTVNARGRRRRENVSSPYVGLNVTRLWSYLCAVAELTRNPDLASLSRTITQADLTSSDPDHEWAVETLRNVPKTAWAWEIPAALEVVAEIAADGEMAATFDERLRGFPGRFGRILTGPDSPYTELAELVMRKLGERRGGVEND